ncbi:hypothetical protein V1527DRAFT_500679 [Lipomyces starkeyi]
MPQTLMGIGLGVTVYQRFGCMYRCENSGEICDRVLSQLSLPRERPLHSYDAQFETCTMQWEGDAASLSEFGLPIFCDFSAKCLSFHINFPNLILLKNPDDSNFRKVFFYGCREKSFNNISIKGTASTAKIWITLAKASGAWPLPELNLKDGRPFNLRQLLAFSTSSQVPVSIVRCRLGMRPTLGLCDHWRGYGPEQILTRLEIAHQTAASGKGCKFHG